MNILLVLPPGQPHTGGNITYSNRIKKGLTPYGIKITITTLDQATKPDYEKADVVHAYNAFRTGRFVLPIVKELKKPMILTITGTDINEYMTKEETRAETFDVVEYASRIIQLTESSRQELIDLVPSAAAKAIVVNLGIDLPPASEKGRADFGLPEDAFIFLLPAGIRPVKNPLVSYEPLKQVHAKHPEVIFAVAGPAMDESLYAEFKPLMDAAEWAFYLGEVQHEDMSALLLSSDVVLNTSKSEGLSHALLEAMSLGKPVLASRVAGNVDLIRDGQNGFLFDTDEEFAEKAMRYIEDAALRNELAQTGQFWVQEHYSVDREIQTFKRIYDEVMNLKYCLQKE